MAVKKVYLIFQRYKFKSKLQLTLYQVLLALGCIWYFKDTNLKANYNLTQSSTTASSVYLIFQRYKFKSKLQRCSPHIYIGQWCIWYFKDTNLKANYNNKRAELLATLGVFNISKIQIQKQITTISVTAALLARVYLIFQRYKFKSKLQQVHIRLQERYGVFDISKIQIQKQITTPIALRAAYPWVYLIFQR